MARSFNACQNQLPTVFAVLEMSRPMPSTVLHAPSVNTTASAKIAFAFMLDPIPLSRAPPLMG